MYYFERIFKLKENNTNIKTEILAGLTTFFTMSYLFVLSPKLLEAAGLNLESTITVTGLIIFICSTIMAFIANKPYAVGPFLGETAFISFTIVNALGFSIKTAFAAIFICGIILLFLTLFNIRTYILQKIPETIKLAFCSGLGLFFIFIALKDIGITQFTTKAVPIESGNFCSLSVILGLFCFILLVTLVRKKVRAAILIAIITTTALGILTGDVILPSSLISLPADITPSLFQMDFTGLLDKNFIAMFFVIFILVNIDTAGAIVSIAYKAGFTDKDGNIPDLKKSMIADSISVILAPIAGTTTPGAYIDSMTGISSGGRTGLTAITVGFLFLTGILFSPLIMIIPPYAYAPVLLYVGILMTTVITKIDFNDITEFAPAIFIISVMIFTYNIGNGIISGFLIYPVIKLLCGQKQKTNPVIWAMFVISIIFFIIYPY